MIARKEVIVYIEGEGGGGTASKRKANDGDFRRSWKQFLRPLVGAADKVGVPIFRCVPGRGGDRVADTFANPLPSQKDALRILIIDSEGPVKDVSRPWNALKAEKPAWADDKHCYLMVQCLETWLLADREKLQDHYDKSKRCFDDKPLKAWDLETTDRKTLQRALEKATEKCGRPYSHADGNMLIAVVRLDELMKLSSVARLFKDLEERIEEYAKT